VVPATVTEATRVLVLAAVAVVVGLYLGYSLIFPERF
jgi:ABC-type anion transport system duplicated permease subunit